MRQQTSFSKIIASAVLLTFLFSNAISFSETSQFSSNFFHRENSLIRPTPFEGTEAGKNFLIDFLRRFVRPLNTPPMGRRELAPILRAELRGAIGKHDFANLDEINDEETGMVIPQDQTRKITPEDSESIWNTLHANGFLDREGRVTAQFNDRAFPLGGRDNFKKLGIDPQFSWFQNQIQGMLRMASAALLLIGSARNWNSAVLKSSSTVLPKLRTLPL